MTVKALSELDGFAPAVICDGDREISGVYIGDLLSWVMGRASSGDAWITIMSNVNILAVASLTDTSCIIIAEDVSLSEDILETAREKDINIIYSSFGIYDTAVFMSQVL